MSRTCRTGPGRRARFAPSLLALAVGACGLVGPPVGRSATPPQRFHWCDRDYLLRERSELAGSP